MKKVKNGQIKAKIVYIGKLTKRFKKSKYLSFQVCVCYCVAGSEVRLPPRGASWMSLKG